MPDKFITGGGMSHPYGNDSVEHLINIADTLTDERDAMIVREYAQEKRRRFAKVSIVLAIARQRLKKDGSTGGGSRQIAE